ncbi:MAG: DsrE family protein [Actinomycetota bacterium]|nr:DsrE family protein [Actinomycetota bacterium]
MAAGSDTGDRATLFVLNDAPYGTERSYNGLRLAGSLARGGDEAIRVFLVGDAAACAKAGQRVPKGYYNVEVMLRAVAREGGEIGVCGTCMDARGIADAELAEDCRRSTLDELADWTRSADRVLVF